MQIGVVNVKEDKYIDQIVEPGNFIVHNNICFDCENAFGKCPWSAVDPETGRVMFEPIPGWKTKRCARKYNGRKWEIVEQIIECPLFKPMPERKR